jgi:hypothetical protein
MFLPQCTKPSFAPIKRRSKNILCYTITQKLNVVFYKTLTVVFTHESCEPTHNKNWAFCQKGLHTPWLESLHFCKFRYSAFYAHRLWQAFFQLCYFASRNATCAACVTAMSVYLRCLWNWPARCLTLRLLSELLTAESSVSIFSTRPLGCCIATSPKCRWVGEWLVATTFSVPQSVFLCGETCNKYLQDSTVKRV